MDSNLRFFVFALGRMRAFPLVRGIGYPEPSAAQMRKSQPTRLRFIIDEMKRGDCKAGRPAFGIAVTAGGLPGNIGRPGDRDAREV